MFLEQKKKLASSSQKCVLRTRNWVNLKGYFLFLNSDSCFVFFFIHFLFPPPPKVFCHFVQTLKYKIECTFLPDLFLVVLVGLFSFQRLNLFLAFIMDKLPVPASIFDQLLKPLKAHFICFTFIWVDFTEKKDAASNVAHPERDVAQSPAAKELHRDRQEQRRLCIWIARRSSQHKVSFLICVYFILSLLSKVPNYTFLPNAHFSSFTYCYQLVNVISFSLSQSDPIKPHLLYWN
jgi:hypothetical protein